MRESDGIVMTWNHHKVDGSTLITEQQNIELGRNTLVSPIRTHSLGTHSRAQPCTLIATSPRPLDEGFLSHVCQVSVCPGTVYYVCRNVNLSSVTVNPILNNNEKRRENIWNVGKNGGKNS